MLSHFKKMFRKIWHDVYYYFASDRGVEFAMTCREASEGIDLKDQNKTLKNKFRLKLHMSLCQSCNNYYIFSQSLSRTIKKALFFHKDNQQDLDQLNTKLLEKFSKR